MNNPIDLFEQNIDKFKAQGRGQYIGLCPFHDDTKQSLSINEDGQYHCFSCGTKGNAITFAKHIGVDEKQYYSDDYQAPIKKEYKSVKTNGKQTKEDVKELVYKYHKEWTDSQHKNIYQVGECDGRMTFTYWKDKEPIGIHHHRHRWEGDGTAKWYGEWQLDYMNKHKPLIIVEGEKDVITMMDNGINAVSSSAGATSVPKYIPPQFYEFKSIIILLDNDDWGDKGNDKLYNELKSKVKGQRILQAYYDKSLPKGFDCSDKNGIQEAKKSIDKVLQLPSQIGAFKIMTDNYMTTTTPPQAEWIINTLLPKDQTSALAGTTGSRKSYMAMQMAMSVANGEKDCMGFPIDNTGLKVLYVDTEIGEAEGVRRFQRIKSKMNWKGNNNWMMITKGGSTVDIWDTVRDIMHWHRAELIVIDSLYNSTKIDDFSKGGNVAKVTDELYKLKDEFDCTTLSVCHFNKGGNDMGLYLDRMSGASQLKNNLEFVMCMTKTNVESLNIAQVGKVRAFYHDNSVLGFEFKDYEFKSKGVINNAKELLLSENKKAKWMDVLEDLPDEFHTTQWLNVFNSKYQSLDERTGTRWLSEAKKTVFVEEMKGRGMYRKGLALIESESIEAE